MSISLNFDKICGICLQQNAEMRSIFERDDEQIPISNKIGKCFPEFHSIQDQNNGAAPSKICEMCLQDLDAAFRFHNNCETALLIFRFSPISHIIESDTSVQMKDVNTKELESPELDKAPKVEEPLQYDSSSNSNIQDTEETEYAEFCELEQLDYGEEHLVDEDAEGTYEPIDDILNAKSETELTALEYPIFNGLDRRDVILSSKVTVTKPTRKRLKNRNPNIQTFKTYKKSKEKCGNTPKICEICGNNYKYQHALNSHMRRHMNEKPFSCECCDKAFVSNVELRRHMRVHTGDKPYRCNYCERKFSDYGSRIKHERTHTGERPFVCQTCNKSFAYAHVLSVHLRTHTGEKKFQCSQCGKGFTKKSYMLTHLEQHRRSALLVLKDEEESHDNYLEPEVKPNLSNVLDNSEGSLDPCITTYIVEEIDGDNNELKVLKDITEVEDQLNDGECNESILGMG